MFPKNKQKPFQSIGSHFQRVELLLNPGENQHLQETSGDWRKGHANLCCCRCQVTNDFLNEINEKRMAEVHIH